MGSPPLEKKKGGPKGKRRGERRRSESPAARVRCVFALGPTPPPRKGRGERGTWVGRRGGKGKKRMVPRNPATTTPPSSAVPAVALRVRAGGKGRGSKKKKKGQEGRGPLLFVLACCAVRGGGEGEGKGGKKKGGSRHYPLPLPSLPLVSDTVEERGRGRREGKKGRGGKNRDRGDADDDYYPSS